jgi:hypothetical protein
MNLKIKSFLIAIIVGMSMLTISSIAKAEETLDKKILNWLVAEKNSIIEFQKSNWKSAKEQNERNIQKLSGFFSDFPNLKAN